MYPVALYTRVRKRVRVNNLILILYVISHRLGVRSRKSRPREAFRRITALVIFIIVRTFNIIIFVLRLLCT